MQVSRRSKHLTVLSLGAGVQSTTLALLAVEGILPRPDAAIFADTGWEPHTVYTHLDRLEPVMQQAGIPVFRVSRGNLRDDVLDPHRHATIPAFTADFVKDLDGPIPVRRQRRGRIGRRCTGRYKVEPIERQVRMLLGARARQVSCTFCSGTGSRVAPWSPDSPPGPCSVCRGSGSRTIVGSVSAGAKATQWVGFSTDEVQRVSSKKFPPYISPVWPLLDLNMSRNDCKAWLAERGWGDTPKSACVGCPFHGNRMWRQFRDTDPESWADAVSFDEAFRRGEGLDGDRFLHASRLPLSIAPIDHVTRAERAELDLEERLAEDGDPDGCSPYACRSGEPVV